ncbi:MAG: RICIN domain-containing protein [Chthoniobacterales bacterium]
MFMDLSGGQNPEEVRLVQSRRRKVLSQVWRIIPADELGSYYLASQDPLYRGSGRCLEVKLGGTDDQIGLGAMAGAKKQQWELVPADPGYYFIKSKFYEKTINAPRGEAVEQPLIMFFFWKGNNEQWKFAPTL